MAERTSSSVVTPTATSFQRFRAPRQEGRSFSRRTPFVPLDRPALLTAVEATYLADEDLVLGLEWEDEYRAYPIRMIWFHHIVNDVVANQPLLVTY